MKSRAFTLVELLIVIIVIAVLAAIAIPKFANSSTAGKESRLRVELKLMRNAIALFQADTGLHPAMLSDLAASTSPAKGLQSDGTAVALSDYRGPYLSEVNTRDPFGSPYTYTITAGKLFGRVKSSTGKYADW